MPKASPATTKKPASHARLVIWVVVAVLAVAATFLVMRPAGASVENVESARLQELAGEGVRIVDVRSAGEYELSHVPGAINIPYTAIGQAAASWDEEQPIAVYCWSGQRSTSAVETLKSLGFSKIYHLNAGFQNWLGPVETGAGGPTTEAASESAATGPAMYEFFSDG